VVAEAFEARVPVISLPCDELKALGEEGCLVVAGGGPRGLADAVVSTLENAELVDRLTSHGRRLWARRYSPAAAANAFDLLAFELGLEPGGDGGGRATGSREGALAESREGAR
jgi:glycosyltransferase involved in cell wall biosynthesis